MDYYKKFSWYLNISDCEGFGLTPLEAMAHGMPLISPYYLPIYEYADSSFTIFIPTKDAWYEPFGWENIEHHIYNTDDMVFAIYKALDMSDNQFANMSENALKKAKMYTPDVYKKFVNLIG
jgi:Glycosyl transferases group 1.